MTCLSPSILSIVLDLSISGAIYSREASPFVTLSIASDLFIGSSRPFIVTASVIPLFARLSTWSFISDCSGDITTVSPWTAFPAISAGNWKVRDFPPPVGNIASSDLPSTAALVAFSCSGSLL